MDIISVSKSILDITYTLADLPLAFRAFPLRLRFGNQAGKIKQLRNKYKGQRCFVLGNGPSLGNMDFGLLRNKNLITVNMLYKYPAYKEIHPIFHCALDPGLYRGEYLDALKDILENRPETNMLVSTNAPVDLRERDNCFTTIFGYLPSRHIHPFNLAKPSAAFVNVVLFAIELAIYLGFKEVVLLGCDFSQFTVRKEIHLYDTEEGKTRLPAVWQDLLGHTIAIMQHESLYDYARSEGVNVVNATEGSFLEVYPRVDINDWL